MFYRNAKSRKSFEEMFYFLLRRVIKIKMLHLNSNNPRGYGNLVNQHCP